jgi:hypothetical protein
MVNSLTLYLMQAHSRTRDEYAPAWGLKIAWFSTWRQEESGREREGLIRLGGVGPEQSQDFFCFRGEVIEPMGLSETQRFGGE